MQFAAGKSNAPSRRRASARVGAQCAPRGKRLVSVSRVGTSIARPAFGTNAICRRQIQRTGLLKRREIALPGDCLLRKRGRAMRVPTFFP
ncbi:MAG: hypothetical protein IKS21_02575 [Oscillospiraceae bacterium]|nr:hypothetical protein [Oscillospiraceae bacterium]